MFDSAVNLDHLKLSYIVISVIRKYPNTSSVIMNRNILVFFISIIILMVGCEKSKTDLSVNKEVANRDKQKLTSATQIDIDTLAAQLDVKFELLTNNIAEKCDKAKTDGLCYEGRLSFTAKQDISAKGWHIFYSQIAPLHNFDSGEFSVSHINGDLHKISLTNEFTGFKKGQTKTLTYRASFWSLAESDLLPNYIVTADHLKARVIESTKVAIDKETGLEYIPYVTEYSDEKNQFKRTADDKTQWLTSENLYQRNHKLTRIDVSEAIIPTPKKVNYHADGAILDLSKGVKIHLGNVSNKDVAVALLRLAKFGIKPTEDGNKLVLSIASDKDKPFGSYKLAITNTSIKVIGVDAAGVANGLNSIASLLTLGQLSVPLMTVEDEPHYEFRGILVDVARNFHSKEFILRLLDQMAAYKLNKLHLHLGDDEGWRLEIPSLPELTQVGAFRCFDLNDDNCLVPQLGAGVDKNALVNGYYSVNDYQEILKAATARHIQVIPSLDMPGHSRAAIKAMAVRSKKFSANEQEEKAQQFNLYEKNDPTQYSSVQFYNDNTINVCLESSYAFVTEVMTQVKQIHADAGQPLTRYHIGADETAGAWLESQACKDFVANNDKGVKDMSELGAYFIERVAGILSELNIETAGWSDGLSHTRKENMPAIVQSNAWDVLFWGGHTKVHEIANRDWQVVISSPDALYFDFPYEADPKEHGYYWASRQINTEKIFQFMPDNLPIHAEFWLDRQDNNYEADDTKTPLNNGQKFLGIQGQLWSENTRNDDMAEYKIYPRLFALAERAWHLADWAVPYNYKGAKYNQESKVFSEQQKALREQDWLQFSNTIGQKALSKLDNEKVFYRLPTVGAKITSGKLFANIAFPGVAIEYKDQTSDWARYQSPVAVKGNVMVRSVSFNNQRKGRITTIKVD